MSEQYRIRKLTPMECWVLMGFSKEDFLSAKIGSREQAKELMCKYPQGGVEMMREAEEKKALSDSQLYKQAATQLL